MGRRVRIQELGPDRNLPFCRYRATRVFYRLDHPIASRKISVANINTETNPAGNAVDGAGEYFANADGCYRIDRRRVTRCLLHCQDQLRGCAESITALWHQHSTRVPARSLDKNAHAGWSGNFGNDAEWYSLTFQQRTLFDVQLKERSVVIERQFDFVEFSP